MTKTKNGQGVATELEWGSLSRFIPEEVKSVFREADIQSAFPTIAKNTALMGLVENAVQQIPTEHQLLLRDATQFRPPAESVHLVLARC
jgi:hypothetical protein